MDSLVKKTGVLFGVVGAAIVIACYLYIWQNEDFANIALGIGIYIIPLAVGIAAQVYSKKRQGGLLTLKQAVLAFFLSVLIIFVGEAVINYLIFVVWDPEAQETVRILQESMVEQEKASSNAAVQVSEIDYSFKGYAIATASKLLFYTVIGIITAFFIKKNKPTT
ncbi:DUF4199 domain-containing protein [Nonlabens marinus]|uniref:DUF4199 domain-containing protein n=1 Tax=Nonlabens marinus S1-08 TaxID=1454201 RepID=W8W0M9_9FLAO|nr:DUF4199 domain-containing protein [Nonlabens marinus]BAO56606.1 hypothetical protein NMS_2597 [Nonlabens marinus S1-08]